MEKLCPNCFQKLTNESRCSHCGYDLINRKKFSGVLPEFTLLNNRYLIGRVLGRGGFGITYIALDNQYGKLCAIKEYMPSEYSKRCDNTFNIEPFSDTKSRNVFAHGREKFMDEARTLLNLQGNPTVVNIYAYFSQNNTAYLVMEYLDGMDLRRRARLNGGKLDPDFAYEVFVTVASSLMEIHKKNILHRDISPENIIVTSNGGIKLIDFGAARNYVSLQNKGMSILLKPGFAPPEQYSTNGNQGPWSDVYALCATFYNIVSGQPLVDALYRYRGTPQPTLKSMGCNVSTKISDVIDKGLSLDYKKRYQDFVSLLNDLSGINIKSATPSKPSAHSKPSMPPIPPTSPKPPALSKPLLQPVKLPKSTPEFKITKYPYLAEIKGNKRYNKTMIGRKNKFIIGRVPMGCSYVINDSKNVTGRNHCYIRFSGNDLFLCDTSSNGTYFEDGTRLKKNVEYKITPGTKFYTAVKQYMFVVDFD